MATEWRADYSFHGGNRAAILCRDPEVILSGPADTGKTLALCWKVNALAAKYPKARLVIARKRQTDVYPTVLQTFMHQVLGPDRRAWPCALYGGENKPEWFDYPNGSRVWVAGLDKPGKVLSAPLDVIYVNQAEEATLGDWETLGTRTTGRAGNIPYGQLIGDCNPEYHLHWILQRRTAGKLTFIESAHRDNPELYNPETGEITPAGVERIGRLDRLTGSRRLRLRVGVWAPPEGAIYGDVFDEDRHKVAPFAVPIHWPRYVGVDPFGDRIAAVWVAWDPGGQVLHVYREYMQPFGVTTPEHAQAVLLAGRGEGILAYVGGGPSERQARADWAGAGVPLVACPVTDVWAGVDRILDLLKNYKLAIHACCPELISEIGGYHRKVRADGTATEEIADKATYHLIDALRYVIGWLTEPWTQYQVVYNPVRIA